MDFFENLFRLHPTKLKVAQNDVNMQEKRLKKFFRSFGGAWGYLRPRRDAKIDFFGNFFRFYPTKIKVTQNNVNMQ